MVDDVILVGGDWNMALIFHFIYGMSSFPLTFIFFRGVETTNQMCISQKFSQILIQSLHLVKKIPGVKRISTVYHISPFADVD
jgi:hypothetical protein